MGNNPVNGVDPDGREWYTNWFGGQKWFDTSPWNSFYWTMNPKGGYNIGNDIYIRTAKPVEIYGRIPLWKSDGQLNPKHKDYSMMVWRERGMQHNREWSHAKGLKEKGLKTMAATAGAVFTGAGMIVYEGTSYIVVYTLGSLSILNRVDDVTGASDNINNDGVKTAIKVYKTAVDLGSVGFSTTSVINDRNVITVPTLIFDIHGLWQDVNSLKSDTTPSPLIKQ